MFALIAVLIFAIAMFFLWNRFSDKETRKNFGFLGKLALALCVLLLGGLALLGFMAQSGR